MPKLFPIHIQVEEGAVGKVMRILNDLEGVAKLNLDLDRTGKPNGSRRPPAKKFDMKGENFVESLLFKDAMKTAVLRDHFRDVGRSPASINSQLSDMKKKGIIKQLDDGLWVLSKTARDRVRRASKKAKD